MSSVCVFQYGSIISIVDLLLQLNSEKYVIVVNVIMTAILVLYIGKSRWRRKCLCVCCVNIYIPLKNHLTVSKKVQITMTSLK
ncbi:hypothetical protein TNIN_294831 [Trichonephila inaurata madagascariensis]|uniref:Uncharacterized protein n=1 Tax=Trichonephila inaurata madagascariensis TaxID=2747483 RepID=A0A8X6MDZ6_9ARAC|nr:hypothetical protein TNIN_294831 [Trichonephila inaurata madagascariensis]